MVVGEVIVTKQHGMLFADRLMPPLLDGRKTQTRRPVNLKHVLSPSQRKIGFEACDDPSKFRRTLLIEGVPRLTIPTRHPEDSKVPWDDCGGECLYSPWSVGDLIWARETWASIGDEDEGVPIACVYRADGGDYSDWESVDGDKFRWKPSIHMPKWACRCWLEITDVRVERIQEISEEDAIAEGSRPGWQEVWWQGYREVDGRLHQAQSVGDEPTDWLLEPKRMDTDHLKTTARDEFSRSWDSIYPGSWERNDYVWALTFKRVEAPQ